MGTITGIEFYPKDERRIDKQYVRELLEILFKNDIGFWDFDPNTKKYIKSRECKLCFRHDTWDYQENITTEKAIEIVSEHGGDFPMVFNTLQFDLAVFNTGLVSIHVMYTIGKEESIAFIDIAKILYNFLCPFYGKGDIEDDDIYDPSKDVKSGYIKHIYWVNFFSPELVQKIGRKKLLSAPSWKTEELKDGGILLMLGQTPYNFKFESEEVEKYLGFGE